MQNITPPASGDHNPNGYTAEEILAALQGQTGSRKFSFRYEQLDETNKKLADLTTVKSARIGQNWLADIKREATFVMTTGPGDGIDYLKHRIKPWVRLHMPPKEIPPPATELPPDPPTPPAFAAFTDDFEEAAIQVADWAYYSNGVANVGGRLRIPAKPDYPGAESNASWVLTGSHVAAEVNTVPSATGGTDVAMSIIILSDTIGTNLTFQYRLTGFGLENRLEFLNFDGGFFDPDAVDIEYDPEEHRWWRIREAGGTIFWETSRTGLPGTWNIQRQIPTPAWVISQSGTLRLFIQANRDAGPEDYAEIGNINLTPEGVEQAFMPQSEWQNNFNGTPGVTGEAITSNNSARHGDAVDEVLGTAIYSDVFSVDNRKSAKLGDDSGTTDGTLKVRLSTSLADWSLRTYFEIPSGGVLRIQPDGPNVDTSNDILLDDDNNVVTFGTVTPPASIMSHLFGQPVKLEVITTPDLTLYRVFWTDITSSSPDYVATESNVGRQSLNGLTIQGGGSTTPPVYVDNVLLAKPAVLARFTPDEVNYVEWPQGVFVLSSPSRESDVSDVVTRNVQGYDLAQILQDDLMPDRFSTANLLRVNDNFLRDTVGQWGTSEDGTVWVHNTVANTVFGTSVNSPGYAFIRVGDDSTTIRLAQAGNTNQEILVDSEVYVRMGVSQLATGNSLLGGIVFRLFNESNYYRLRIRYQTNGLIGLDVTRTATQFGSTVVPGVTYTAGQYINVRAQCVGHVIRGKVWAVGAPEPITWQIQQEITTNPIDSGYTGVSGSNFSGMTNVNPEHRWDRFELNPNPLNLYTEVVHHLLHERNLPHNIAHSSAVIPTVKEWEAGTSARQIINDLLSAINYESIAFDEDGTAVVKPYVSPQLRPTEYTYRDDSLSIMYPEVLQELDLFTVPNRWVLTLSDPDREAITVVVTNNDPASPTSTVRRGRVITDFRNETDVSDEATMVEKAGRLAFEASQVYEAIEFDTGLNPLHSGNDVYTVVYDTLGINGQFQEHSWEMTLQAGVKMRHRARRVITLQAEQDPSIITDNLVVTGAVEAGNIAAGVQSITPVANIPTARAITGLSLVGRGPVRVVATAEGTVPGSQLKEVSVTKPLPSGFILWVYRTNTTATNVHWFAVRGA